MFMKRYCTSQRPSQSTAGTRTNLLTKVTIQNLWGISEFVFFNYYQNTNWGNTFWKNGVHPSSTVPEWSWSYSVGFSFIFVCTWTYMHWSVMSGGYARMEGRKGYSEIIQDMGSVDYRRRKRKALVCMCVCVVCPRRNFIGQRTSLTLSLTKQSQNWPQ